jgi:hypothetical protein
MCIYIEEKNTAKVKQMSIKGGVVDMVEKVKSCWYPK